jgi:hypothetical protein
VAHGEIPYKDFDMVYTPLSFVITSGFFKILGESVFVGRIVAVVLSMFTLNAVYLLLRLVTKNKLLIFVCILFFIAWGPSHINFPWPTMFAACFFLYASLFYLQGIQKKLDKYFLLAGIMTALTFLSKQNFGLGTLAVLTLAFLFINFPNKKKHFIRYLLGITTVSFFYVTYLVSSNSLFPFLQNMNLYTLQRVFIDKSLETPFLYEGPFYVKVAKLLFYTSPLVISIAAYIIVRKSSKKIFLIPILTAMFYLLGIRPTTDYVHVVSLLALSCLPLAIIIIYTKKKFIRQSGIAFLVIMTVVGFYTAYFKGYYQWEAPLRDTNYLSSNPRIKVYLTDIQTTETDNLLAYIHRKTKRDDYIFVNYYGPMIYFISDRKNPTPYDLISTNQLPFAYQTNIITTLKEKDIRLVIGHKQNDKEQNIVNSYIKKNFKLNNIIGPFLIYER